MAKTFALSHDTIPLTAKLFGERENVKISDFAIPKSRAAGLATILELSDNDNATT